MSKITRHEAVNKFGKKCVYTAESLFPDMWLLDGDKIEECLYRAKFAIVDKEAAKKSFDCNAFVTTMFKMFSQCDDVCEKFNEAITHVVPDTWENDTATDDCRMMKLGTELFECFFSDTTKKAIASQIENHMSLHYSEDFKLV
jgi:hypothetical protein